MLTKFTIRNPMPLAYKGGDPRTIRFDVTLHDESGPAWDLGGFMVNWKGYVTPPKVYSKRGFQLSGIVTPRPDQLVALAEAWRSHPRLAEIAAEAFAALGTAKELQDKVRSSEEIEIGVEV